MFIPKINNNKKISILSVIKNGERLELFYIGGNIYITVQSIWKTVFQLL